MTTVVSCPNTTMHHCNSLHSHPQPLQLVHTAQPKLIKRYVKPVLAERLYYLGVVPSAAAQDLRMRELVFDWLGVCDPPLPREAALQVLGVERCVWK